MLIKELNLYINEKNIVTLKPYVANSAYGLEINGVQYKFGEMALDKDVQKAKLSKMKALQTQLIKKVEK
jgi:hypothetical protein